MAFSRAASLRSLRAKATFRPQFSRIGQRPYASAGHGHVKASSDAPWAIGAVVVTIPTCWYLLSGPSTTSHGHGDHDDHDHESNDKQKESHDEDSKQNDEGGPKDDGSRDDTETEEKSQSSSTESDHEDGNSETPETSDDDSKVVSEDDKNVRKHIPDAKGGAKARIESKASIKQGELSEGDKGDNDTAASSKPAGGPNTQSGKQEGISNTDTKHSVDIQNDPEKSKKGEGSPETAKLKGTVDVNRPQT